MSSGQNSQSDGWDLWQLGSYAATGLSLLSLTAKGKQAKGLGQAGTVLGMISSVAHGVTAPPRCTTCKCRTTRVSASMAWACPACGAQQA
jgi:hypothetical protein